MVFDCQFIDCFGYVCLFVVVVGEQFECGDVGVVVDDMVYCFGMCFRGDLCVFFCVWYEVLYDCYIGGQLQYQWNYQLLVGLCEQIQCGIGVDYDVLE